jgi:hypothetical protein
VEDLEKVQVEIAKTANAPNRTAIVTEGNAEAVPAELGRVVKLHWDMVKVFSANAATPGVCRGSSRLRLARPGLDSDGAGASHCRDESSGHFLM